MILAEFSPRPFAYVSEQSKQSSALLACAKTAKRGYGALFINCQNSLWRTPYLGKTKGA